MAEDGWIKEQDKERDWTVEKNTTMEANSVIQRDHSQDNQPLWWCIHSCMGTVFPLHSPQDISLPPSHLHCYNAHLQCLWVRALITATFSTTSIVISGSGAIFRKSRGTKVDSKEEFILWYYLLLALLHWTIFSRLDKVSTLKINRKQWNSVVPGYSWSDIMAMLYHVWVFRI